MKFNYNKNLESNKLTSPFLRTMEKLDQVHQTILICNNFDDDELREQLEGKQSRLVQRLTRGYESVFNIKATNTIDELCDAGCLMEYLCQENITSIEKQITGGCEE